MTQVESSKIVGYSVLDYPEGEQAASKVVAYAVLDVEKAQVYSSKIVSYAVVTPVPEVPVVGNVLGYEGDTWAHEPTSFIHQWQRDGVDIAGATGETYTLVAADEGALIRHVLIAVNASGQSEPVTSEAVGPIAP